MFTHTTIVLYPSYTAPQELCGYKHPLKYSTTNFDTLTIQPTPIGFDTTNQVVHRTLMVVDSPTWGWQLLRK